MNSRNRKGVTSAKAAAIHSPRFSTQHDPHCPVKSAGTALQQYREGALRLRCPAVSPTDQVSPEQQNQGCGKARPNFTRRHNLDPSTLCTATTPLAQPRPSHQKLSLEPFGSAIKNRTAKKNAPTYSSFGPLWTLHSSKTCSLASSWPESSVLRVCNQNFF